MGERLKREFGLSAIVQSVTPRMGELPRMESVSIDPTTGRENTEELKQAEALRRVRQGLPAEEPQQPGPQGVVGFDIKTRPSFLQAFLRNLPAAIAGSFQPIVGPGGRTGFAGFPGGFAAVHGQQAEARQSGERQRAFGLRERELGLEERRQQLAESQATRPKYQQFGNAIFTTDEAGNLAKVRDVPEADKLPKTFNELALRLKMIGREDEAKEILDFFRPGRSPIHEKVGNDLVFLDSDNLTEIKRIPGFFPKSLAEKRSALQGEIDQLASAFLVQAGGDVKRAFGLAREKAAQDPNGFTSKNLVGIMRAIRVGNLDDANRETIELLRFGTIGQEEQ